MLFLEEIVEIIEREKRKTIHPSLVFGSIISTDE
jgi:hypothetical protein